MSQCKIQKKNVNFCPKKTPPPIKMMGNDLKEKNTDK